MLQISEKVTAALVVISPQANVGNISITAYKMIVCGQRDGQERKSKLLETGDYSSKLTQG